MLWQASVVSEAGGRAVNQDRVGSFAREGAVAWVVCDGLGGHGGGELAAHLAVEAMGEAFGAGGGVAAMFEAANARILEAQGAHPRQSQMRTTAVALLIDSGGMHWGWVGDSRLYAFSVGGIVDRTWDHSVPQALVEAGELSPGEIRGHPDRNRLVRSLGAPGCRPSFGGSTAEAFLLASDGFWEWVEEQEMTADLEGAATAAEWLGRMVARLQARATGEFDNYSAITIGRSE